MMKAEQTGYLDLIFQISETRPPLLNRTDTPGDSFHDHQNGIILSTMMMMIGVVFKLLMFLFHQPQVYSYLNNKLYSPPERYICILPNLTLYKKYQQKFNSLL